VLAKFQARLWSGLGSIYPGVRLIFLDLHNDLVLSYFEGPVRTQNLSALPLLERKMWTLWGPLVNPVYATVDYGGVHEARLLAEKRKCGFAHIDKKRLSSTETEIREVHGNVNGCDVVIFDDMISTGGSLAKAAHVYKERGARRVFAVAAHGLFVNNAVAKLRASPIERVLVTDSHPNAALAHAQASGFITVYQLRPEQLAPVV
jgi:ribose-phosphate pyrophosphokinase